MLPTDPAGRVVKDDGGGDGEEGVPMHGIYATGWLRRGPSGVISTNKVGRVEI